MMIAGGGLVYFENKRSPLIVVVGSFLAFFHERLHSNALDCREKEQPIKMKQSSAVRIGQSRNTFLLWHELTILTTPRRSI